MSDLSPQSQGIVDAGRDAVEPTLADKERVRSALAAKIAATMAAGATLAAAPSSASTTAAGATTKIIMSVVLALGMGAGSFAVYRWQSGSQNVQPVEPPAIAAPVQPAPVEQPKAVTANDDPFIEEFPVADLSERNKHERVGKPPPASGASTLAEELLLIRTAGTALTQGDAERALKLLREHKHRFPNAVLLQEAAAVRIDALCQMGRNQLAKRHTTNFLRRWPRSPLAARVKTTCGYEEDTQ